MCDVYTETTSTSVIIHWLDWTLHLFPIIFVKISVTVNSGIILFILLLHVHVQL